MPTRLRTRASYKAWIERAELEKLLLESAHEAIYGIDMAGACTFCNPECLRLLGYKDTTELVGKNMHSTIHHTGPDGKPLPNHQCRIYFAFRQGEGSHADDEIFWRADGTSFPVEYWSCPVRENKLLIGAVVTFGDITERKRAEYALQESAEMFRQLAERIREILFIVTPDPPRMAYISPMYEEVFGKPRQELYDRADVWIDSVLPDDRSRVQAVFEQAMRGVTTNMEYRLNRPDGSVRWIYSRSFPVEDSQGKLCRIVGIAEDITDRKRVLEQTEAARAAAEAAKRAKSRSLGNISHKVRTEIHTILGTTALLLDTELTSEQAEYLQMMKTSADSLLAMIDDMLVSKGEAGEL